jgi:hypothetical protein
MNASCHQIAVLLLGSSNFEIHVHPPPAVFNFGTPDPPLVACFVPIPHAGVNEHPIVRIAISLATLSAYLREDVLLDLFS